jgi:hypothetical protein
MYERYRPGPLQGTRIGIGFVQLDGIAGLLFVAEKLGALLEEGCDLNGEWLISVAAESAGEEPVWEALRAAAPTNKLIAGFCRSAEAKKVRRPEHEDLAVATN